MDILHERTSADAGINLDIYACPSRNKLYLQMHTGRTGVQYISQKKRRPRYDEQVRFQTSSGAQSPVNLFFSFPVAAPPTKETFQVEEVDPGSGHVQSMVEDGPQLYAAVCASSVVIKE